ncbi:hypothetical protein GDI2611 [Gluconacetobacter diazotrophicus PA1 5]|uniref:Invasin n=1 Tax=Gluconacetobacter diazotrophicus (strain ATCC 49037 / DSM 5601 / CCUG 37298 / CIP 103539 / LMG 7603 / PAl5) TaxID=272568 RepID=A9HP79_GLUDA|nr:hypothetical protein GDI2611 [Gluconacetobacter diazotrophicus PA1 5]
MVDLTGFVFASQIRDSQGNQIAALSAVVPANTTGILNLSFAGSTATWAAGNYLCDVVFTSPTGLVTATETFAVTVIPGVTQIGNPTP